jgi:NAD(P)H-hydrate repair Nnr-like enzyme with NAD(P)H-hydrate dehydratase domain
MSDYLQQTAADPLFPKILYNRPISRGSSGTLLVIGGHAKQFDDIQAVYQYAVACGIGKCQVVLPDSLRKLLQGFDDTWFVPSSPSGSIGRASLGEIDELLLSADGLIIGPNLSSNSETAIVAEKVITEAKVPMVVAADAIDGLTFHAQAMTSRAECVLVLDMAQLFKLAGALKLPLAVRPERGILGRVEIVQQVAAITKSAIVCFGREIIIGQNDQVSVTTALEPPTPELVAGLVSSFWTQQHGDSFERLTTAAYVCAAALATTEGKSTPNGVLASEVSRVLDVY